MVRQLFFLCAGKLEKDDKQSLRDQSKRKVQRMGLRFGRLCPNPDVLLYTDNNAAKASFFKALKASGLPLDQLPISDSIACATDDLLDRLRSLAQSCQRVLVVAKKSELRRLLPYLSDMAIPKHASGKLLPRASLTELQLIGDWSQLGPDSCQVQQCVFADDLPQQFPFPLDGGIDYRDRPAYYYSQSAVIPYRWFDQQLQVLIISSSSGRKWGVPKGIAEPNMTPWDSAAKEAFEEAGIRGQVGTQALGQYRYAKWGSFCDVLVYPLRVTEQLSDSDWLESHRQRLWVSLAQAQQQISTPALWPYMQQLAQQLSQEAQHG